MKTGAGSTWIESIFPLQTLTGSLQDSQKCLTLWDRNLCDGTSPAPLDADTNGGTSTLGLAEFCNGNFLTVRGTYAEYTNIGNFVRRGGPALGVTAYPYPSIASTDLSNFLQILPLLEPPMETEYIDSLLRRAVRELLSRSIVPLTCWLRFGQINFLLMVCTRTIRTLWRAITPS